MEEQPIVPAEERNPFGETITKETNVEEVKTEEPKKEYTPIPEDHPVIVSLKKDIDTVKNTYGNNLSGQRKIIDELNATIKSLKEGKKEEVEEGLYKKEDIMWSKDLTKEERDNMTDNEIRQMDEIASMKVAQNKMFKDMKNEVKVLTPEPLDINKIVREKALELSKKDEIEDEIVANKIIESYNNLKFDTTGLSAQDVIQRVVLSAKSVPEYTPAKENSVVTPSSPVKNETDKKDPFGVDKIVEETHSKGSIGVTAL